MDAPFPTLLVSRRARQVGVDWTGARSWLGGAPRIGAVPWPRNNKGEPLLFVAQIDLAEVAAKTGKTSLPDKGSIAFFVAGEGAVVFVPEGQNITPVMPPAGTPELVECGCSADWRTDLAGRPLFPYWPVDFAVLAVMPPASDEDDDAFEAFSAAEVAAVERLFPRRQYVLTPDQAFAGPSIPAGGRPPSTMQTISKKWSWIFRTWSSASKGRSIMRERNWRKRSPKARAN